MPILIVVVAMFLAGCAQPLLYVKDGATAEQFEADKFDCEHKVTTMYGGYAQMGAGHYILARQDMLRCMRAKGYREASSTDYAAARRSSSESPTPEAVYREKYKAAGFEEYPRPTTCVGQGCTPSTGQ